MEQHDAVDEVCKRRGDSAAVCVNGLPSSKSYDAGYFEQTEDRMIFHIIGSGDTLEAAFAAADNATASTVLSQQSFYRAVTGGNCRK